MNVQVIGSGDAFGTYGKLQTSFLLRTSSSNIMIDCGATTLLGCKQLNIDVLDIDEIVISHFHGDHFGGLPWLIMEMHKLNREQPLHIYTPLGGFGKVEALMDSLYVDSSRLLHDLAITWHEFGLNKMEINRKVFLETYPVVHSPKALPFGIKITDTQLEKTIGYSGDSSWCDGLVQSAHQSDLFICECNYFDTKIEGHLSYLELMEKKTQLKSSTVMLTHLGAEMWENQALVELPILSDGMIYAI